MSTLEEDNLPLISTDEDRNYSRRRWNNSDKFDLDLNQQIYHRKNYLSLNHSPFHDADYDMTPISKLPSKVIIILKLV